MHRRSFFGVVVGGFLARWLPQPRTVSDALFPASDPRQRLGYMAATDDMLVMGAEPDLELPKEMHGDVQWYRYRQHPDGTYGFSKIR